MHDDFCLSLTAESEDLPFFCHYEQLSVSGQHPVGRPVNLRPPSDLQRATVPIGNVNSHNRRLAARV